MKKGLFVVFFVLLCACIVWAICATVYLHYQSWDTYITPSMKFHAMWKPVVGVVFAALGVGWFSNK